MNNRSIMSFAKIFNGLEQNHGLISRGVSNSGNADGQWFRLDNTHFHPFGQGHKGFLKLYLAQFNMINLNTESKQYIYFPKSWDDKWSKEDLTDIERAKGFLYDFFGNNGGSDELNRSLWQVLFASVVDSVTQLATGIQWLVFHNKHVTFHTNWLLHRMRFILIKCLPNLPRTLSTDRLRHFFFDPAIRYRLPPGITRPSDDLIALELPKSRVKVVIIGGGPTGLSAAINLAERVRCRELVQIHVFEKRWQNQRLGELHFTAYPEDERRRDQVITLQDHVKDLLSTETKNFLHYGLEKHGAELVWPESSNLQISKVEDALLKRAQDSAFDGIIHLHGADIKDEETLLTEAGNDFQLLLAADGANSWVRTRYFSEDVEHRGTSFALGVALDRGDRGLPRPQALNIFLTLSQTRFLLNASDRDSTGYLNVLLTQKEYDQCVSIDNSPADFRSPACILRNNSVPLGFTRNQIFAPYNDKKSPLWRSINDGLYLFGFLRQDVKSIARIPINLIAVNRSTKEIRFKSADKRHDHCLVSLAGDAALTHHFWPGRGMNSGIKAAIAWSNQISDLILERNEGLVGLQTQALAPFSEFMTRLRNREHDQRSLVIQRTSGSPELMEQKMSQAQKQREPEWDIDPVLCKRVLDFADRLEGRGKPRWHHEKIKGLKGQVFEILSLLGRETKAEMKHSGPWPTEEMSAPEELPPEPRIHNLPRIMASCETDNLQVSLENLNRLKSAIHTTLSHWLSFEYMDRIVACIDNVPTGFWHKVPNRLIAENVDSPSGHILIQSLLAVLLTCVGIMWEHCTLPVIQTGFVLGLALTVIVLTLGAIWWGVRLWDRIQG